LQLALLRKIPASYEIFFLCYGCYGVNVKGPAAAGPY